MAREVFRDPLLTPVIIQRGKLDVTLGADRDFMQRFLTILLIVAVVAGFLLLTVREAQAFIHLFILPEPGVLTWRPVITPDEPEEPLEVNFGRKVTTLVTGYNTVQAQTDSTPCIAANGENICGRRDTVACPRSIAFGTEVKIDNEIYICMDRLAEKFDHRFDINCDKDFECPGEVHGEKEVEIFD